MASMVKDVTENASDGKEPTTNEQALAKDILSEAELLQTIPVSRRTLCSWRAKGIIPFIRIGRRILFHRKSVEGALLRMQRGGVI